MMKSKRYLGDRYELVERIGRGGTGDVFRAVDHAFGMARPVCIKCIAPSLTADLIRELDEEARLLARVRHANVVSLLGIVSDERAAPALVLELIDGADLRRFCASSFKPPRQRGLLPDRVAVHVACCVLRALAAVQRAIPGLVHRDVTPHNILVSKEGEVKLADFGIALAPIRERITKPLRVKGKLGYMAPEQVRGDDLDPRVDVFAAGVILYELLAGIRPWGNVTGMAELRSIEQGQERHIEELRPIDRSLAGVVMKMLAHDRETRLNSAEEALRVLAPFGAGDLGSLHLSSMWRTMEYKIPLHGSRLCDIALAKTHTAPVVNAETRNEKAKSRRTKTRG